MLARHSAQRIADLQSDAATDSGVYLVENQCRHIVHFGENRLERQHHPRQLATRRHTGERALLVPDIERDPELDVLGPRGGWLVAHHQRSGEAPIGHSELG